MLGLSISFCSINSLIFFESMPSYGDMCSRSYVHALDIPEVGQNDVIFDNFFAQGRRIFTISHDGNDFSLFFKRCPHQLGESIVMCLQCDGDNIELVLPATTCLEQLDDRFNGINLNLVQDDIRQQLMMCLLEKCRMSLEHALSMPVKIVAVQFDGNMNSSFDRECGIEIRKDNSVISLMNLRCNDSFFQRVTGLFSDCEQDSVMIDCELPFLRYIRIGNTQLSQEEYSSLEEYDIVFLEDTSCVDSNCYQLSGINGMTVTCTYKNGSLVVDKVVV